MPHQRMRRNRYQDSQRRSSPRPASPRLSPFSATMNSPMVSELSAAPARSKFSRMVRGGRCDRCAAISAAMPSSGRARRSIATMRSAGSGRRPADRWPMQWLRLPPGCRYHRRAGGWDRCGASRALETLHDSCGRKPLHVRVQTGGRRSSAPVRWLSMSRSATAVRRHRPRGNRRGRQSPRAETMRWLWPVIGVGQQHGPGRRRAQFAGNRRQRDIHGRTVDDRQVVPSARAATASRRCRAGRPSSCSFWRRNSG